jgi:hypothetical protein
MEQGAMGRYVYARLAEEEASSYRHLGSLAIHRPGGA